MSIAHRLTVRSAGAWSKPAYASLRRVQIHRSYASMQEYRNRIQTVENVEKITSSLKMVAASKLKIAQRKLEPAQLFADTVSRFFSDLKAGEADPEMGDASGDKHLIVLTTTDRGMCGALSANVVRAAGELTEKDKSDTEFVCVGTKGADGLVSARLNNQISTVIIEMGQKPTTFSEVSYTAEQIVRRPGVARVSVLYNKFYNLLKNELLTMAIVPLAQMRASEKWEEVEDEDDDMYLSLAEYQFGAEMWRAIHENQTCEHAVRMTSMDGASTNAGDLLTSLRLVYNKARQAAITTELSEIVSGMAAIMDG